MIGWDSYFDPLRDFIITKNFEVDQIDSINFYEMT